MCPCVKGMLSERWDKSHPSFKVTLWWILSVLGLWAEMPAGRLGAYLIQAR